MKKTLKYTGLVLMIATFSAGTALAFGPGPRGERMNFGSLDSDASGEITREELEANGKARFAETDSDGDGKLSLAELQAHAIARMEDRTSRMLERFDSDGDGFLTAGEMPGNQRTEMFFERLDRDGSGGVSEEEFAQARGKMKRHGSHRHDRSGEDNN